MQMNHFYKARAPTVLPESCVNCVGPAALSLAVLSVSPVLLTVDSDHLLLIIFHADQLP
jgi:hypothetical protein